MGGIIGGEPVPFHEITAGEIFIGRVDTIEIFPGYAHEPGQTGTGTHKDRIKLYQNAIDGPGLSDDVIQIQFNSKTFDILDLSFDNGFGQTKFRNTIGQDTPRLMQGLEYRYGIPQAGRDHWPP
jgi:hypothetical protein